MWQSESDIFGKTVINVLLWEQASYEQEETTDGIEMGMKKIDHYLNPLTFIIQYVECDQKKAADFKVRTNWWNKNHKNCRG
jgi:hypothetical protein